MYVSSLNVFYLNLPDFLKNKITYWRICLFFFNFTVPNEKNMNKFPHFKNTSSEGMLRSILSDIY